MALLADSVVQARKKGDAQHCAKALKRSLLALPPRWLCCFTQTFCRLLESEPAVVIIFSLRLTTLGGALQRAVARYCIFAALLKSHIVVVDCALAGLFSCVL